MILLNGLSVGWLGFQTEFTKLNRFGLAMVLLGFFSEAEKSILLNGMALGWLGFQNKYRDLMHRLRLAMGLVVFLTEAERSILLNGFAVASSLSKPS